MSEDKIETHLAIAMELATNVEMSYTEKIKFESGMRKAHSTISDNSTGLYKFCGEDDE